MPIYKISKRSEQNGQEHRLHGRLRLITLLLTGLLFLATAVLLAGHLAHFPA